MSATNNNCECVDCHCNDYGCCECTQECSTSSQRNADNIYVESNPPAETSCETSCETGSVGGSCCRRQTTERTNGEYYYSKLCSGCRALHQSLCSQQTASYFGVAAGIVWTLYPPTSNNNILTHPLSTLFNSTIYSTFTAFGAGWVSSSLPRALRFIVPVALSVSVAHYVRMLSV